MLARAQLYQIALLKRQHAQCSTALNFNIQVALYNCQMIENFTRLIHRTPVKPGDYKKHYILKKHCLNNQFFFYAFIFCYPLECQCASHGSSYECGAIERNLRGRMLRHNKANIARFWALRKKGSERALIGQLVVAPLSCFDVAV